MDFKVVPEKYYNNLTDRLQVIFPAFHSVFDKEDGVYPIAGELGDYIIENIEDENVLNQAVKFINEALATKEQKTEELIAIQLFQKFYETELVAKTFKQHLSKHSAEVFDKCNTQ